MNKLLQVILISTILLICDMAKEITKLGYLDIRGAQVQNLPTDVSGIIYLSSIGKFINNDIMSFKDGG